MNEQVDQPENHPEGMDEGQFDYFSAPAFQLLDPDTLLLMYKEHIVHLKGRDGHPGNRGLNTAVRLIDKLDELKEEIPCEHAYSRKLTVRLFLSGIWYDCKNPNVNVYFVTEPSSQALSKTLPSEIYGSIFRQAKTILPFVMRLEPGQNIEGNIAEFVYTGGADYDHGVNRFFGRAGLFLGLAGIQDGELIDFEYGCSLWSHPSDIVEGFGDQKTFRELKILPYSEFVAQMKSPPRGRHGIADMLNWGSITGDDLKRMMAEAKPLNPEYRDPEDYCVGEQDLREILGTDDPIPVVDSPEPIDDSMPESLRDKDPRDERRDDDEFPNLIEDEDPLPDLDDQDED